MAFSSSIHGELGTGIYSVPDMAFILGLPQPKVRRWLNDFWDTRLAAQQHQLYSWRTGPNKTTGFFTLVELHVCHMLRKLKIGPVRILAMHSRMAQHLGTPFPFAASRLLSDGRHVWYSLPDGAVVSAGKRQQIVMGGILSELCPLLEYTDEGKACRFWPLGKDRKIIADPQHQFGQPVVRGTNILAETLHRLHEAGDTPVTLRRLYGLDEDELADALELFHRKKKR